MKKEGTKTQGLIRGTSSALVISIAIHGAVIAGAMGFVAYKYIKKKQTVFVPEPMKERPKMDLIKPKVKVRKTKPRNMKRISVDSPVSTPSIAVPELSGITGAGGGLGGGLGGMELVPEVSQMSILGSQFSVETGNDFEGTYYNLSYDRAGKHVPVGRGEFEGALKEFGKSWNANVFAKYFRGPKKLYTTHFCIPTFPLAFVPGYFGIKDPLEFDPRNSVAIYKGKMTSKKGGRYRFWGSCDGFLTVRINGKVVIDEGWGPNLGLVTGGWKSSDPDTDTYGLVRFKSTIGDWFELEAGKANEMEVLMANMGGLASWVLVIENEAEDYEETEDGGICLPAFRTAPFSENVKREIEYLSYRDVMDLEGGEIFNVY